MHVMLSGGEAEVETSPDPNPHPDDRRKEGISALFPPEQDTLAVLGMREGRE